MHRSRVIPAIDKSSKNMATTCVDSAASGRATHAPATEPEPAAPRSKARNMNARPIHLPAASPIHSANCRVKPWHGATASNALIVTFFDAFPPAHLSVRCVATPSPSRATPVTRLRSISMVRSPSTPLSANTRAYSICTSLRGSEVPGRRPPTPSSSRKQSTHAPACASSSSSFSTSVGLFADVHTWSLPSRPGGNGALKRV